jgi:hypothetical protein
MLGMRAPPQLARANDIAVVAPALLMVDVVPMVSAACSFTIFALRNQPANLSRQMAAKPRSPVVRVAFDFVWVFPHMVLAV